MLPRVDASERQRRLRTFEANGHAVGCQPVAGPCPRMLCLCSSWRPTRYERVLLRIRRLRRRMFRFLFAP